MSSNQFDVVVVGAGISGLVCAQELLKRGMKVLVLEAQSRVGGRIFTERNPSLNTPMELGAEFIHGVPESTMKRFESFGVPIYDGCDNHLFYQNGELKNFDDFWERIGKLMEHLKPERKKDRSVSEFLESQKKADSEVRQAFTAFVEGFHAADTLQMSEKGLALTEETDDDSLNETQMFRIPGGYDQLVHGIFHALPNAQDVVRLNTVVKKISWKKRSVEITAQSTKGVPLNNIRAKAVVITVPLGVLKAPPSAQAAIELNPRPSILDDCLSGMKMGDVQRITFQFRSRFWEKLSREPVGFLHAGPDKYFPTWWTLMPMRTPLLVAWQGGPKAAELAHWSEEERVKTALLTLSELTGESLTFLNEQLQGWATHNWTMDPFFLGAYSYILVDGVEKANRFNKAIEETIYFAGEATAPKSDRGTVHGALESGLRAARQILKKSSFSLASKSHLNSISP